jgi:excisionase family DNA binding protein
MGDEQKRNHRHGGKTRMAEVNVTEGLPEFIPVPMAARILNVSPAKIYMLINGKDIPAYRFGKSWRIKRQDFNDYIKGSKGKE